ncbi:MAG: helicase-related protein [Hyphomicrobiales bacterium]
MTINVVTGAFEAVKVASTRGVTAVLGPTNTGKTHLAIERMVKHPTGMMGLPLRLLAREVYSKVVAKVGEHNVALITGEEKITPAKPRFWICTVEAMPLDIAVNFVAIDEVQLAHSFERGHIFTDRILNMRGTHETLLLGAATARPILEDLMPGLNVSVRPRLSDLTYAGPKKISRLPRRSAVVAFSSQDVYGIAELIRRQSGGAAVVLGSLSPRTRNAQVELFQNGDVDYLVATDAIGMGLNLDVDHVALSAIRKFDGFQFRDLTPAELGQIVGRAGRYTRDGTFGVTSRVEGFDVGLVEQLESHVFEPLKVFQWRTGKLDFSSLKDLRDSLDAAPKSAMLVKSPVGDDIVTLEAAMRDADVRDMTTTSEDVAKLWDVCSMPDYRKISPAEHADLVLTVYGHLQKEGWVREEWLASQIARADRVDGDIDTLSNRIAHIRTWTYIANRSDWLENAIAWREEARDVEDRLSDALHECLTKRFVDRRTSVLMKKLKESTMLEAEVTHDGDVIVEGENIGTLEGLRFSADTNGTSGSEAKTVRAAAQKALASEIEKRSQRIDKAPNEAFLISSDGSIRWLGAVIARITASDDILAPNFIVLADEQLTGPAAERVDTRLRLWLDAHIATVLQPLVDLRKSEDFEGLARGIAFQLVEAFGVLDRRDVAEDIKNLDQAARGSLRQFGVRFGAYHIFIPLLLKPAPATLVALLWGLKEDKLDNKGISEVPALSAAGRTSFAIDPEVPEALYRVAGFKVAGNRAVRVDILERLADIIRPLLNWKPSTNETEPPEGALREFGFTVTVDMTSLLGCAGEDFTSVLKSLGYRFEKRKVVEKKKETASESDDAPIDNGELAADNAATTEKEATTEKTAPEIEQSSDASTEAATTAEEPAATEVASAAESESEAEEALTEANEPVFIEIWRPAPANRDTNKRTHKAHNKDAQGHKGQRGKNAKPSRKGGDKHSQKNNKSENKPRKEKPMDPDSPFAKLAALKAGLAKK